MRPPRRPRRPAPLPRDLAVQPRRLVRPQSPRPSRRLRRPRTRRQRKRRHRGTRRAALARHPLLLGRRRPDRPELRHRQGAGTKGFDCSGLTQYAWAKAGTQLPRVAAAQYNAGPHILRTQLRPGDLLFFATDTRNPATIHHVGLYYGHGQMIHAPQTGDIVRISQFTGNPYREHQYIGATRPSTPRISA
ncbi:C40 family peptidase [Actinomadura napierensis]|uniref:C40 family peptidase n=1 Tax=Actinomadura napierensis TaxID=267854 RepID=UPI0031E48EF7